MNQPPAKNTKHIPPHSRYGLTLIEVLVVLFVIVMLIALLITTGRNGRGAARRMSCANNLKQIGIALHNYHDTHGHFPSAMGGTGRGPTPFLGNANRLSGLVAILPFMEHQTLWDEIANPTGQDSRFPPMGPAPWVEEFEPWRVELTPYRCPTTQDEADESDLPQTNYGFCIGDLARDIHNPTVRRGVFAGGMVTTLADLKDGTSNTIMMGELGNPAGRAVVGQYAIGQPRSVLNTPSLCRRRLDHRKPELYAKNTRLSSDGRGSRWADGRASSALFNTILAPNSPSCAIGSRAAVDGIYSAGSYHPGGAQCTFADASVRFLSESIDAGNSTKPTLKPSQLREPSPYGVWGALGTSASHDEVGND